MNGRKFINKIIMGLWLTCTMALVHAGTPIWTFTPLTQTTITVAANDTAIVRYQVTNQSRMTHTLVMKAISGVTQITTSGNCPTPFVLGYQQSCTLSLSINGSALNEYVHGGPVVCSRGNPNQCYQPSAANSLHITKGPAVEYTIGGSVFGLSGTLVLENNGGDALTMNVDGTFTFSNALPPGSTYLVTVQSQPANQTCIVTNGSGTITNANITNVMVNCSANSRTVGGSVSGLAASQSVVLQNNGSDNLTVNSNGSFTFSTPIAQGAVYNVTILTQPSTQICTVTNGSGTAGTANITNVQVTCADNAYTVGGSVFGLSGTLVLENNGSDALTMNADGTFTFSNALPPGSTYSVTVQSQPATQTCTVTNGSGTMANANITNVTVNCSTNTRTVGGSVSGLAVSQSVVLQNNGSDNLTVNSNGSFTFSTPVAQGATYNVTVLTQPSTQTCTVTNGSGTAGTANITNVQVTCADNAYTVGGTVSGLSGTIVLLDNGGDDLTINSNGAFTFATPVAQGASYSVTVLTQPAGQICNVTNGSGTMGGANVTNVGVNCISNATTLSTSVSQLALSVTGFTEFGVSGTPSSGLARVITITNTGSNTANNLAVTPPTWPTGTSSITTCGSTLAASSSCTITITPGATATSDGTNPCSSGTAPIPGAVQVSADNALTVSTNVVVLSYGCVYQGGYVYAFDDTTPTTGSVGGKVITTSDQAAPYPSGIIWSSNGTSGAPSSVVYDAIYGISETSTTGSPNPNSGQVLGQVACNGATDGSCDTNNIYIYYKNNATNAPINPSYYATGLCIQTISTYFDWYLPAICEMGYGSTACGTSVTPTLQNIQSSLINSSAFTAPAGYYWSSTEVSANSLNNAWSQNFTSGGGNQGVSSKSDLLGVRCSRALTF